MYYWKLICVVKYGLHFDIQMLVSLLLTWVLYVLVTLTLYQQEINLKKHQVNNSTSEDPQIFKKDNGKHIFGFSMKNSSIRYG